MVALETVAGLEVTALVVEVGGRDRGRGARRDRRGRRGLGVGLAAVAAGPGRGPGQNPGRGAGEGAGAPAGGGGGAGATAEGLLGRARLLGVAGGDWGGDVVEGRERWEGGRA